jgi:hypothetical protein
MLNFDKQTQTCILQSRNSKTDSFVARTVTSSFKTGLKISLSLYFPEFHLHYCNDAVFSRNKFIMYL